MPRKDPEARKRAAKEWRERQRRELGEAFTADETLRKSEQRARQTAAQNPTVQQVLRAFGGEIVDVKLR